MKFKNNSSRLEELDVLRGFAALNVVLFHYTTMYNKEYGNHSSFGYEWTYGYFGVQLFFVISGFVIFLTLQNIKSVGDFAYKRFTRLYPTYWICLLLTFSLVSIFGLPGREVTSKEALIGLTMLQSLFKLKSVDGAYWSLLPELLFYLMMGLIFRLNLLNRIRIIGFVWLLIILFNIYHHIPYCRLILNLEYGMYFLAGIIFFKIKSGKHDFLDHLIILLCFTTAVLSSHTYPALIADLIIFFLFYLFVFGKLKFLCSKYLTFLGIISYPFYLVHQNIGFILMRILSNSIPNRIALISLVIILIILLAWIITNYLEKPIIKKLRKKQQQPENKTGVLPTCNHIVN